MYPQRVRVTAMALPHLDRRGPERIAAQSASACPIGLETRIDVPEHPPLRLAAFHRCRPLPAKANFIHPMAQGKRRHQQSERGENCGPRLVQKQRFDDAEYVCGQRAVSSMPSLHTALARAKSGKKFV